MRACESSHVAFAPQVGLGDGRLTMFACETRRLLERHRVELLLETALEPEPEPEPEPEREA